jgi:hypothetical protein
MGAKLDSNVYSGGGTDDSAALQAGLNLSVNYKAYEFVVDGPALISTNLVINSNTKLRFTTGGGLFMAPHANCWLIGNQQNTNYSSTNIVVEGGVLNGNGNSQNEYITNGFRLNGAPGVWGVWFAGVDGLILRDVKTISAKTYSFLFNDSRNILIQNCWAQFTNNVASTNTLYGNDGLHFMCNISNVRVDGFRHTLGQDDTIALMTDETDFTLPFNDPRWTTNSGTITNIVIENVFIESGKNLGKMQTYGSTNAAVYDLTMRNFHGSVTHQGFLTFPLSGAIPMNNIVIENWNFTVSGNLDPFGSPILKLDGLIGDNLFLNNVRLVDNNGGGIGNTGFISLPSSVTNVALANIFCTGSANSVSSADSAVSISQSPPFQNKVSIVNLSAKSLGSAVQGDAATGIAPGAFKVSGVQIPDGGTLYIGSFTNIMNGNEPKLISTNWISGKLYTNVSGALQYVQCPVSVTTAAINGSARVEFVVGTGTTPLFTNAIFGGQTTGSSLAVTNLGTLTGYVLPSQMFYFSNSLVGAGDAARTLPNGQQVTY